MAKRWRECVDEDHRRFHGTGKAMPKRSINVRVEHDVYDTVHRKSAKRKETAAQWVAEAIRQRLEREKESA